MVLKQSSVALCDGSRLMVNRKSTGFSSFRKIGTLSNVSEARNAGNPQNCSKSWDPSLLSSVKEGKGIMIVSGEPKPFVWSLSIQVQAGL